jgi:PAS domain-containing protein
VVDEKGNRRGVLAQLLHNLPLSGIDGLARKKPGQQTKSEGSQQPSANDNERQVDSKQTQLFQRFAELVPNGLAILDSDAEAVFVNDGFFALTTNKTSKDFRAWPQSIDTADYDRVMSAYRTAFSSRQELRVEFRCAGEASDDEREWRLFLLRPLSDESEAGFICAVVDITDIKQAQLAQEKAAMEARERKEQQERFIDMV